MSHRKHVDDGAVCEAKMFKDLAEQRDRVEEGGLVLGQDLPLAWEGEAKCLGRS